MGFCNAFMVVQMFSQLSSPVVFPQAAQTRRVKTCKDLYGNLDNKLNKIKVLNKKAYIVVVSFSVFVWFLPD